MMRQGGGGTGQQRPSIQQGLQGLFGRDMAPMWAALAFGGTRQDQGRLAAQALQQRSQLGQQQQQFDASAALDRERMAQQQAQFGARQGLAREQFNALERYRQAQLQQQAQNANRNPILEQIRQIEAIPDQYFGPEPDSARRAMIGSLLGGGEGEQRSFPDMVKGESNLRKEINSLPQVKTALEGMQSYRRIEVAAQGSKDGEYRGADDIAIVFNFMKMLDPESVIRESEYATARNASGVSDRVRSIYNRLMQGDQLTPEQRQMFLDAAGRQANEYASTLKGVRERYGPITDHYGFDQSRVLPPMPELPQGGAGTVRRRFTADGELQ